MSKYQLQTNLQDDLKTIKKIRLGIIPANIFYKDIIKYFLLTYIFLVGALLLACFFASSIHAWPYTPEYAKQVENIKRYGAPIRLQVGFMNEEESYKFHKYKRKPLEEKITELKNEYSDEHLNLLIEMVLGVLAVSLFLMIFLNGKIKSYVIYKHQISDQLKTGSYLKRKILQAYAGFLVTFSLFAMVTISLMNQNLTFFSGILAFIFAGVVSSVLIEMELTRIGISPLTNAIADYFEVDKPVLAKPS